jgi:cellobiose phosphorylase
MFWQIRIRHYHFEKAAYTWAANSHEYRLTPRNNDPVTDPSGEAMYIRDDETGHFWSPTPLTDSESKLYVCRWIRI